MVRGFRAFTLSKTLKLSSSFRLELGGLDGKKHELIVHEFDEQFLHQIENYETRKINTSETTIQSYQYPQDWELLRCIYMMDSKTIQELQVLEDKLENDLLNRMSKHKIEELQRIIATHFVKRFIGKRKKAKYGNISKCFKDSEITAFFKVVDDTKFRLLFLYQSTLGLRIGEAVQINIKDLNLESRELLIRTEKEGVGMVDSLIVPIELFNETLEFIKENQRDIEKAQGYVFFADSHKTVRKGLYLEKNGVRNKFREYCERAGLADVYSVSDESKGRTVRRLHRLSTHSLRHYAITKFAKQSNGNLILTSRFARHQSPNTTMTYVAKDKDKLYETIEQTTALSEVMALKGRVK